MPGVSYDLYLLKREPGEATMDTLARLEQREQAPSADPAVAERNRRIADRLIAMNSDYTESQAGDDTFIELFDEDGLQITLSGEHAAFNFPYWEPLDPRRLAEEMARASKVIGDETGWELYDPQPEKFVDPLRDADEFARAFGVGVSHVQRLVAGQEAAGDQRPSLLRRILRRP